MFITAICMPSNHIVYNSRGMIVAISAICKLSNLIVYNSRDQILVVSTF